MAELWPKMWFSIWRPPPSWILLDMSSEGKSCPGTLFSVSVSNLVQIRSKMAELLPFNGFQNGGCRHLGFLHYVNFDGKSVCGTRFSTSVSNAVQLRAIMAELWPKMWFSIWRPPPCWILLDTSSEDKSCPGTLFSVSVTNLVQIRSKMAELLPFNGFKNGGRRHFEFLHYVNFDGKSVCGTPFSTSVSNLVQMHAIMAKLRPKMWFSIWRPPPSWICWIRVLRVKSVQGPYSPCLYQIWSKSVQKWRSYGGLTDFKMAAAAILDFCTMWILAENLTAGPIVNLHFKFGANACENGRVTAKNVIFNMAAAAVLEFGGYEFWG